MNDRHEFLADFDKVGCPAMVVDNHLAEIPTDYVASDYASGAEQVLNYLTQLGHRNIAMITAGGDISTSRIVREIYEKKLGDAGATPDASWVIDGEFTEEGGAMAARELMSRHPEITAMFCGNDKMAIGAMHQLHLLGLKVPQDVSVIGFDDLQHAAFVNPSLTTIHLPLYQVGSLAMDKLIERIHGRAERVEETLSTHLVVRDSTALARTT